MFGTIKIELIALFDERCAAIASIVVVAAAAIVVVVATTSPGDKEMPYREFNNSKPLLFDGVRDPIAAMRWVSNMEGCFYTCACPTNLKCRCA